LSVDMVTIAIKTAEAVREKKKLSVVGKVKSGLVDVVKTLSEYSTLFSVIPVQDRYLSLITGTLTIIAKVRILQPYGPGDLSFAIILRTLASPTFQSQTFATAVQWASLTLIAPAVSVPDFTDEVHSCLGLPGVSFSRRLTSFHS
jgi:hypothetical protein